MGVQGTLIERYVGGPNIVFLNGHDWKRHRKVHEKFQVALGAKHPNLDCQSSISSCIPSETLWRFDTKHVQGSR